MSLLRPPDDAERSFSDQFRTTRAENAVPASVPVEAAAS